MKVSELIERLSKFDQDLPVVVEAYEENKLVYYSINDAFIPEDDFDNGEDIIVLGIDLESEMVIIDNT
jgi:hypothetical protein